MAEVDPILLAIEGDSSGADEALAAMDEALMGVDEAFAALQEGLASISEYFDALSATAGSTAETMGLMGEAATGADASLSSIAEAAGAADEAMVTVAESSNAAAAGLGEVGAAALANTASLDAQAVAADTSAASADTNTAATDANTGAKDTNTAANDANATSTGKLNMLLLGAGVAIAATGVAAVMMAGNFQAGITTLITGAGEFEQNRKMISDGILQMAIDTGTSTKQLIDGMFSIESSGFHGAAGLEVLKNAAEGAKVGNADLATVAHAVASAMVTYGDSADQAANVTNTLVATVSAGDMHMQDLSGALATVMLTAKNAGVSLAETGAALAVMTSEGLTAANAATYLKQMFVGLETPGSKARSTLESIGLSADQVAQDMRKQPDGMIDALREINVALDTKFPASAAIAQQEMDKVKNHQETMDQAMTNLANNTSPAYIGALKDIAGGSKNMQALLALTGTGLQTLQGNFDSITGAVKQGGGAITGWSKVQDDFNFKMDRAKEVVGNLFIDIGTKLLPVVGNMADGLAKNVVPALQNFGHFLEKNHDAAAAVANVVGGVLLAALWSIVAPLGAAALAAAPLVLTLAGIGLAVTLIVMHWKQLQDFFTSSAPPAIALKGILLALGGALAGLGVALLINALPAIWLSVTAFTAQAGAALLAAGATLLAAAPFILIGAAIGIVIGLIILLITHWKQVTDFLGNVWNTIKKKAEEIWGHITKFLHDLWEGIKKKAEDVWNGIKQKAEDIWNNIKKFFTDLVEGIKKKIEDIWNDIKKFLGDLWDGIKQKAKDFVDGIVNSFSWLYNHNYYIKDLVDFIHNAFLWIRDKAIEIWNHITKFLTDLWNGVKQKAEEIWKGVTTAIHNALTWVRDRATEIWNHIKQFLTDLWNGIKDDAKKAWDWVKDHIITPITDAWNKVKEIGGKITKALQDTWNTVKTDVTTAWDNFIGTISGLCNRITTAIHDNVVKPIGDAMDNLVKGAGKWGSDMVHGFVDGIKNAAGEVGKAAGNVATTIAGFLGFHHSTFTPPVNGPASKADTWMDALGLGLAEGLDNQAAKVKASAQHIASALTPIAGTSPTVSAPITGSGMNNPQVIALLSQMVQLMQQTARNGGSNGGSTSTNNTTYNIPINTAQSSTALYRLLNQLAGNASESASRGSMGGLGI